MQENTGSNSPILVLGPAYSGKSEFAATLLEPKDKTLVLGTSMIEDPDFIEHLNALKSSRPEGWTQQDQPFNLSETLLNLSQNYTQILIDSLNQWVGNLITDSYQKRDLSQTQKILEEEKHQILDSLNVACQNKCKIVLVSNEVAAGITPHRDMERLYRQSVGLLNREIASMCSQVYLINAGIPQKIK